MEEGSCVGREYFKKNIFLFIFTFLTTTLDTIQWPWFKYHCNGEDCDQVTYMPAACLSN